MFAYLKGTIQAKEMSGGPVDRLVLDVSGVGFELSVSHNTLMTVGQIGDDVIVHVSLAVRENDWTPLWFCHTGRAHTLWFTQSVSQWYWSKTGAGTSRYTRGRYSGGRSA
ncbi:MAG: hypothetical protein IPL73_05965 [Candidatus Obscuribacter sp.]|nr:hypothetical protein [Candidatus Obscuribacter sp.]